MRSASSSALHFTGFGPSLQRDLPVAGVYGNNHSFAAVVAADLPHHVGVSHRRCADDDAFHSCRQPCTGCGSAADATSHLHGNVQSRNYGGDDLQVGRFAGCCSVQVHDVEAGATLLLPVERHGDRVVGEHRLALEVALVQSHTPAAAQVNRRNHFHRGFRIQWVPAPLTAMSTKLR